MFDDIGFNMATFKQFSSMLMLLFAVVFFFMGNKVEAARGPKITHKVYFDIVQGEKELGRIEIGLYGGTVPKVS